MIGSACIHRIAVMVLNDSKEAMLFNAVHHFLHPTVDKDKHNCSPKRNGSKDQEETAKTDLLSDRFDVGPRKTASKVGDEVGNEEHSKH